MTRRDPLLVVCIVAFVSGLASLVYQIQWQRELSLIIGVSHYATTAVLLTFFLGFGLGAWLMHRHLNPDRAPFLWMVVVEGVTGLYGVLSPWAFDLIQHAGGLIFRLDHGGLLRAFEAGAFAVAGLLLPTVCMGATLPIFYSAAIKSLDTKSTRLSLVSAINTVGALLGSLIVTFWWMGSIASDRQILYAAVLNGAGFALSIFLWRSQRVAKVMVESSPAPHPVSIDRRLLWSYFLSGAAALGLELIWNRMVYLSLDHTIYTFALTLTVYLWSFSLGLFLSGPLMRRFRPARLNQALLLGLALLSAVVGFQLYRRGIHVNQFVPLIGYASSAVFVTMSFVFLPSLFLGIASPQLLHLLTHRLSRLGKETSRLLLFNNLGSVIAILIVGFFLLPYIGIRGAAIFCLLLLAAAVLILIDFERFHGAVKPMMIGFAGVAAMVIVWAGCHDLNAGHVRLFYQRPAAILEDESGIWGLDAFDGGLILKLNGYYENHLPLPPRGTIQGDFLIPAMVQPEIHSVFMVGLGLGVGAHELLRLPELRSFDAAEISRGAVSLAQSVWSAYGGGFFKDPRFRSRIEDGRVVLTHSKKNYDAIISGTNRSFYAGSTHIYSEEYWRMVRERLTERGMLLQWLPLYSEDSALSLLRTFTAVFTGTLLLRYQEYYYLLGFKRLELSSLESDVASAYAQRGEILKTTVLPSSKSFFNRLYRLRQDPPQIDIPFNRDDFPFVEYSFRWSEGSNESPTLRKLLESFFEPYLSEER